MVVAFAHYEALGSCIRRLRLLSRLVGDSPREALELQWRRGVERSQNFIYALILGTGKSYSSSNIEGAIQAADKGGAE